jgi:hypothetical protein
VSLFNPDALERARQSAGVLPTTVAKHVRWSVDRLGAVNANPRRDSEITLAELRRLAQSVGVTSTDLLVDPREEAAHALCSQLSAVVLCEGIRQAPQIAERLGVEVEDIFDAIDVWNANPGLTGLRIVVNDDHLILQPDPRTQLPPVPRREPRVPPAAANQDVLLFKVIDREVDDEIDAKLAKRFAALEREGLICRRDGEWRPTDAVIEALDLTDWDSTELIEFAAGRDTSGLVTDPE